MDVLRKRRQCISQVVRHTEGLQGDAAQLLEMRFPIRLMVLLVSPLRHDYKARGRQPFQLALNRPDARAGEADDLVGVVAAVRISEQQPQNSALRPGEQRIRHARS